MLRSMAKGEAATPKSPKTACLVGPDAEAVTKGLALEARNHSRGGENRVLDTTRVTNCIASAT